MIFGTYFQTFGFFIVSITMSAQAQADRQIEIQRCLRQPRTSNYSPLGKKTWPLHTETLLLITSR